MNEVKFAYPSCQTQLAAPVGMGYIMKRIVYLILFLLSYEYVFAQRPAIIGFDRFGVLTFQSSQPGQQFTLEFASSPDGPWVDWGSVSQQPITGQVMSVQTPMFFRISESLPTAENAIVDPAFRSYLVSHGYDHDGDSIIDASEAQLIPEMRVEYAGFQSLDFNPLSNISRLDLINLPLLSDIDISACTNLTTFFLYYCPLMANVNFPAELELHANYILGTAVTDFVVPKFTSAIVQRTLQCDINDNPKLTNITFEASSGPERMHVERNDVLTSLELPAYDRLTSLIAEGNPLLEEVVVGLCTNIYQLSLNDNEITHLDISNLTNLTELSINGPIEEITVWWTPPTIEDKPGNLYLYLGGANPVLRNP
jgi:hypothetical protein